jgi:hypothetical protein
MEFKFESFDLRNGMSQKWPCLKQDDTGLLCGSLQTELDAYREVATWMRKFPALFSDKLGTVKGMTCHLDLTDHIPVRSRQYKCSPPRLQKLREIVHDLLEKGAVKQSYSQDASPAFLVPKPSGDQRMVVHYRLVNKNIVFDAFPMRNVDCAFVNFAKAKVFSVVDLNPAYYQIPLSAKSRKVTAFCTPFGLFEFIKLPMRISVGCQVLSRVVDSLFGDLKHKFVYNFMDDLVVYSNSPEEHVQHLREVFTRLEKAGFTLNPKKLRLAQEQIPFLGHLVSSQGIAILPERVEAIKSFPPPKNLKAVRRFLGMVGFYGRFIERFSHVAEPLHSLTRKGVKFIWGQAQQLAFQQLQHALVTPPMLQIPDFSKSFALMCDASDIAISSVLHQKYGEDLLPIAYSNRLLMPAERKYSAHEKECLAVVFGCEKHRRYLEHREFELFTDNQAMSWLLRHAKQLGRIARWILRLAPFKFRVSHISGKANVVADCLTRQHDEPSGGSFVFRPGSRKLARRLPIDQGTSEEGSLL